MARGVHLVGSIPFKSSREVFIETSRALPNRLRRIPDGETGTRYYFVRWQKDVFPEEVLAPHLRADKSPGPSPNEFNCRLEHLKSTAYDEWAMSSYNDFRQLRDQKLIPQGVRFQVCLPTPISVINSRVDPRWRSLIEPLYEQRLLEALARIQDGIPASDLAVQWDAPFELAFMEHEKGRFDAVKPWFAPISDGILTRITRLSRAVREGVELGYHLCYGDSEHQHFIQPLDMSLLARLAHDITAHVASFHQIAFFHMPVPKDRQDAAYFKPLVNMDIGDAELFLGLVHSHDKEGTKKRIEVASQTYKKSFGIATECGMGRTPLDEVPSILEISSELCQPYGEKSRV